ncbi:hypothetical protein B8P98_25175 [Klebsiella quasivariicola]|nr:hypothetical protein B8P98_25175 [Klebsiella quasivariicola]
MLAKMKAALRSRGNVLRRRDDLRGHAHRHARNAVGLSSGLKTAPGPDQLLHPEVKAPERVTYFCP